MIGWCDSTTSWRFLVTYSMAARMRRSQARVSHTRMSTSFCDACRMIRWDFTSCSAYESRSSLRTAARIPSNSLCSAAVLAFSVGAALRPLISSKAARTSYTSCISFGFGG